MNYMNNMNALTFMKVEGLEVDKAHIMFNNLSSELDRWTKWMGNMRTKKNLLFGINFGKVVQTHVSRRLWGCKKKKKKPKRRQK
jgi:hypothetical protein